MLDIKKIVCMIVLLVTSLSSAEPLIIRKSSLFTPSHLGKVDLLHDDAGFHILKGGKKHDIQKCFTDRSLRNVSSHKLAAFLQHGFLRVNQSDDGEYSLKAHVRGLGGGAGGATAGFWIGRGLVYGLSYGTIGVVSLFSGPMAPATFAALSATFAPAIEGAAQVGQLAGGIAGGVATGPV